MHQEDMYQAMYKEWLAERRQGQAPPDLAREVMRNVRAMAESSQEEQRAGWFPGLPAALDWLLRASAAAALSALGLYRLSWVAWKLLVP